MEYPDVDVSVSGAKDLAGNPQIPATVEDLFDIDTKNPTGTVTVNIDPVHTDSPTQTVTVTYDEDMDNDSTPIIDFAGSTNFTYNLDGNWSDARTWSGTYTHNGTPEEVPSITVTSSGATDLAGNLEGPSVPATFDIDTVEPNGIVSVGTEVIYTDDLVQEVTVFYPEPMDPLSRPNITFEGTAGTFTSNGDGAWSVGDTVWTESFTYDGTEEQISGIIVGNSGGATDVAGNPEGPSFTATFDIDMIAPNGAVTVDTAYIYTGDLIQEVTVFYTEPMDPLSTPTITFTGHDGNLSSNGDGEWNEGNNVWTETFTHNGSWEVNYGVTVESSGATDASGNPEGICTPAMFNIDTVKPKVTMTIGDPINQFNVTAVTVIITSDEDGTYEYTISDGTNEMTDSGPISAGELELSLDLSALADGNITGRATITDAAGNMGIAKANVREDELWYAEASEIVYSVSISSDGSYIAAGDSGGYLSLYSKDSYELWYTEPYDSIRSVSISSDGSYIATGDDGGYVTLYSKDSSEPLWWYQTGGTVYSVSISSDGSYIAAGSDDHYVYLFSRDQDPETPAPDWQYETGNTVYTVAISSDGAYIAAGSDDYYVYLLRNDPDDTYVWEYETDSAIYSVAISSDGSYIAAGNGWGYVYLFSDDPDDPYLWEYVTGNTVNSVSISSDGSYIAAGSSDYCVYFFQNDPDDPYLWSYQTGDAVYSVSITSDGSYIAAVSDDCCVYLFSKDSSDPLWYYWTEGYPYSVSISSDGAYIAAGDDYWYLYLFSFTATKDTVPPAFADVDLPIISRARDGSETAHDTNIHYFFDGDTINILVKTTEPGLMVQGDFSQLGGGTVDGDPLDDDPTEYLISYTVGELDVYGGYAIPVTLIDIAGNYTVSDESIAFVAVMNINPKTDVEELNSPNTTDWRDINDFTDVTELVFEGSINGIPVGQIHFLESINLCDMATIMALQSLGEHMQIALGQMSLDTAANALAAMNKESELIMDNLFSFTTTPGILKNGVLVLLSGYTENEASGIAGLDWDNTLKQLTFTVGGWSTYEADGKPTLIENIASSVTSSSATITWQTDENAATVVEYGTTTSYGSTVSSSALVKNHSMSLTGLSAGTTYHFRVKSKDLAGVENVSADGTFTTSQAQAAGTTTPTGGYAITVENITPGSAATVDVESTAITSLEITVNSSVSNVKVTIEETSMPSGISIGAPGDLSAT